MNEEMKPTSLPVQPVSMHETPHKSHGALPLIAAMLGVFLVLALVALGYVVKEYVMDEQAEETIETTDDREAMIEQRIEEAKAKLVPFLYTDNGWNNGNMFSFLKQVNRQTGNETLILEGKDLYFISLVAVPQVGYDGRVFIHQGCGECDNPYYSLYELDMNSEERVPEPFTIVDGNLARGGTAVSPDQTKMAIAHYDDVEIGHTGEVIIYDFVSGEKQVVGELAEDEYFTSYFGNNVFAGASGYSIFWNNRECFSLTIYEDPAGFDPAAPYDPTDTNQKIYKESRQYCTE
jgi:hypothetical protein